MIQTCHCLESTVYSCCKNRSGRSWNIFDIFACRGEKKKGGIRISVPCSIFETSINFWGFQLMILMLSWIHGNSVKRLRNNSRCRAMPLTKQETHLYVYIYIYVCVCVLLFIHLFIFLFLFILKIVFIFVFISLHIYRQPHAYMYQLMYLIICHFITCISVCVRVRLMHTSIN